MDCWTIWKRKVSFHFPGKRLNILVGSREDQLISKNRKAVREVLRAAYKRDLTSFFKENPVIFDLFYI